MLVQRVDRTVPVLMTPQQNPDGSVWFEGRAAAAGIYTYRDMDGNEVRELIDTDVLLSSKSLSTLGGAAVTLLHPPKFVTPETYSTYSVGHVGSIVEKDDDGGFVIVKTRVHRSDALHSIRQAKTLELSAGYEAEVQKTPGTHSKFGRYDQKQVSRSYNHLALVPAGRHGRNVSLRADARVMRLDGAPAWTISNEDEDMSTEDTKTILDAITGLSTAVKANTDELNGLKGRLDATENPKEAEDKFDAEAERAAAKVWAKQRHGLETAAAELKIDGAADMDDSKLLRAVIVKARPTVKERLEDADEATARALWLEIQSSRSTDGWKLDAEDALPTKRTRKTDGEVVIPFNIAAELRQDSILRGETP